MHDTKKIKSNNRLEKRANRAVRRTPASEGTVKTRAPALWLDFEPLAVLGPFQISITHEILNERVSRFVLDILERNDLLLASLVHRAVKSSTCDGIL